MVLVIIDRFRKRAFSIPYKKIIETPETARLFIHYVYRVYGAPDTIVSSPSPDESAQLHVEFGGVGAMP